MIRALDPHDLLRRAEPIVDRVGAVAAVVAHHATRLARNTADHFAERPEHAAAIAAGLALLLLALRLVRWIRRRRSGTRRDPLVRVQSARSLFRSGATVRDVIRRTGLPRDGALLLRLTHNAAAFAGRRQPLPASARTSSRTPLYRSRDAAALYEQLCGGTHVASGMPRTTRGGSTR
jgi:hypothetical protein